MFFARGFVDHSDSFSSFDSDVNDFYVSFEEVVYKTALSGGVIDKFKINFRSNNGYTALMLAVERENIQVLRALLEAGADVNVSRSSYGSYTALSLAVDKGHTTAVRELLQHGAFLSCEKGIEALDMARENNFLDAVVKGEELLISQNMYHTTEDKTAVSVSFQQNRLDLVKALIKAGSYISLMHKSTYTKRLNNKYLLEYFLEEGIDVNMVFQEDETMLTKAVTYKSIECVDILIKAKSNKTFARKNQWTILHIAAYGQRSNINFVTKDTQLPDNKELVKMLIEAGAVVNAETSDGQTPLHFASRFGDIESMKYLIEAGGLVNALDKCGHSILHEAIEDKNIEKLAYLVKAGANVNVPNKSGVLPIVSILEFGSVELLKQFIVQGADVNVCDTKNNSCLVLAIRKRNIEVAKWLVQKGANVNVTTENHVPLLLLATESGDAELVKNILQCGADVTKTDQVGNTCLHIAVIAGGFQENVQVLSEGRVNGCLEIIDILIKAGSDINQTNEKLESPLHVAIKGKDYNSVKNLVHYNPVVRVLDQNKTTQFNLDNKTACTKMIHLLINQGAALNIADEHGKTPLHYCVEKMDLDYVNILIEAGADVNITDEKQETALICAAKILLQIRSMDKEMIEEVMKIFLTLITAEARVNVSDVAGNTALHYAVQSKNVDMVQRLIDAGADVTVSNNRGETVLHVAAKYRCIKITDILLNVEKSFEIINAKDLYTEKPPLKLRNFYHFQSFKKKPTTPLEIALYERNTQDYGEIVRRSQQNRESCAPGETALMVALRNYNDDVACKLLSYNADVNIKNEKGYTALHMAVLGLSRKALPLILQQGCSVNVQAENGDTPLMLADDKSIVKLLCDTGADVNLRNCEGKSALHYAIFYGKINLVRLLVEAGAEINSNVPEPLPHLILAVCFNDQDMVEFLLTAGADVNAVSSCGTPPLIAAAENIDSTLYPEEHTHFTMFDILLRGGADINITDKNGLTALMYITKRQCLNKYLDCFLRFGVNLDIKDREKRSALTYCLMIQDKGIRIAQAEMLLKRGANPIIDEEYRRLLIDSNTTDVCSLFHTINFGALLTFGKLEYLRMLVCNGVMLETFTLIEHPEGKLILPNLMISLQQGRTDVTKYMIATGYLNLHQIHLYLNCTSSSASEHRSLSSTETDFLKDATSEPWPLVKLAFLTVSTMLGESPKREERLSHIHLPPKLKQLLMFQNPFSRLPVSEWSKIPLCFDPVVYETLPRPRPLLYYWPCGQDL
ncbi:putative ankyrin repeat protein RF_0381 [Physella acuta]|uniref:putative ankyrin repeat protein RF_0381 n=1 Tax=Physella acuta TaxID=109671 RepID=UPI0027DD0446|nr:putative ankyrin repeat protein RF_0381 [Physella acuta]